MSATAEMQIFLREGLRRYADAKEAVTVFEREVQDLLVRSIEAKTDWRHFRPQRGERGRGKALASDVYAGAGELTIWASQLSALDEGWLQLQLTWPSSGERARVRACCARYDAGYKVTKGLRLPDPKPPVAYEKVDGKRRLCMAIDDGRTDLEAILRLLLDELDRALAYDGSA